MALRIRQTITPVDLTHDFVERISQRFDQDMIVVRHKTPRQDCEWIAGMDFHKYPLQFMHILFCPKNRLSVIAAQNDVVIGIRIEFTLPRHLRLPHQRILRN